MVVKNRTPVVDVTPIVPSDQNAPMTSAQADVLRALCDKTGEPFDSTLSQEQAEERIVALEEEADAG